MVWNPAQYAENQLAHVLESHHDEEVSVEAVLRLEPLVVAQMLLTLRREYVALRQDWLMDGNRTKNIRHALRYRRERDELRERIKGSH